MEENPNSLGEAGAPETPAPATPVPPPSDIAPQSSDSAQRTSDDRLSRNLLIAGLVIVAVALGFHLLSPQPQPGSAIKTASSATASADVAPRAVPSIRGKDAPQFTLKNLQGQPVALKDFAGKIVLVNFWATWCQPCLLEIPWFIDFQQKYGKDGFQVVAISLDEEGPKVVAPYVEKHNMQTLAVVMGEEKTPNDFGGLVGLPTTFMVDRAGKFYSKHQGLVGKDEVEEEIQILLTLDEVQPAAAPASGY